MLERVAAEAGFECGCTRTCCATGVAISWPMTRATPARSKITSGISSRDDGTRSISATRFALLRPRKSGSQVTPRWREMDSNPRSPGHRIFRRDRSDEPDRMARPSAHLASTPVSAAPGSAGREEAIWRPITSRRSRGRPAPHRLPGKLVLHFGYWVLLSGEPRV